MPQRLKQGWSHVATLLIVFLVVVVAGRIIFFVRGGSQIPSGSEEETTTGVNFEIEKKSEMTVVSTNADEGESIVDCVNKLKSEASVGDVDYVKGSILVVFTSDTSYIKAKSVLAAYGTVVRDESQAKGSFTAGRRITGAVAPGEEFNKVCLLKRDAHVKYAGPETYFWLHQ